MLWWVPWSIKLFHYVVLVANPPKDSSPSKKNGQDSSKSKKVLKVTSERLAYCSSVESKVK